MPAIQTRIVLLCALGLSSQSACLSPGHATSYSYVSSPSADAITATQSTTPYSQTEATPPASAVASTPGVGMPIVSLVDSNACLSVSSSLAGAQVVASPCTSGERWKLSAGLVVLNGNLCLDAAPVADPNTATLPIVSVCNVQSATQQWNYVGGTLRIAATERCLAWPTEATGSVVSLALVDCADATPDVHKQWELGDQNGVEIVSMSNPNTCLRTANEQVSSGASVVVGACSPSAPQRWQFSDGTVMLDGLCLDLVNAAPNDDTPMKIATCNGGANQQWMLRFGHLRLSALLECAEQTVTTLGDGTGASIETCSTSIAQQFTFQ